jgi:hypothetical protein
MSFNPVGLSLSEADLRVLCHAMLGEVVASAPLAIQALGDPLITEVHYVRKNMTLRWCQH